MAQRIVQALENLSRELGIAVLTPEYELLIALLAAGSLATEELCEQSALSRSGFFHALDRLKHWQLIDCAPDPHDRRRKCYHLVPEVAAILANNLRAFSETEGREAMQGTGRADPAAAERPAPGPGGYTSLRLPHLTCDYQILLHLYYRPGACNGAVAGAITASPTTFHAALTRLVGMGLVVRHDDASDKRRKRYDLARPVREAIARANRVVAEWSG